MPPKDQIAPLLDRYSASERFADTLIEELKMIKSPAVAARQLSFAHWCASRVYITPEEGGNVIPFMMKATQRKLRAFKIRAVRAGKERRFLILKARRQGVTTYEQAASYYHAVMNKNMTVATMADTDPKAAKIFKMILQMYKRDPYAPYGRTTGSTLNIHETGSHFLTGTARASSPIRGLTLHRFHGSEVAFWCQGPNQIKDQEHLLGEITQATAKGEVTLETTANGAEHFRVLWNEAKKGINNWTPIFFRWFDDATYTRPVTDAQVDEIEQTLSGAEKTLIRKFGLTPGQIAWRRMKMMELKSLFPQEYPEDDESCFLLSGACYFDQRMLVDMLEAMPDYFSITINGVKFMHVPGGYYVEWEPPKEGVDYRMGADTSEGLAHSDPCGYGILRQDTGEQVAAIHGQFDPRTLAEHCVSGARRYNDALIGVERNNHGHAVIQKIIDLGWMGAARLFESAPGRPGWDTNGATRPVLISELSDAIQRGYMPVRDRQLLQECTTFVKQGDGGYAAASGSHDDCVMKWGIAWQMRKALRPNHMPTVVSRNADPSAA